MKITMSKSVSLCGVKPEINAADVIVANAAERLGCEWLVISCVRDGQHSYGSLHYPGQAKDYDWINATELQMGLWKAEVETNISEEYDIVNEESHLHVEWQPKKNTRC